MKNETAYPFEEGVYRDANAIEFEVVVKRARSKEEMDEPLPQPARTAERLPWAERALTRLRRTPKVTAGRTSAARAVEGLWADRCAG